MKTIAFSLTMLSLVGCSQASLPVSSMDLSDYKGSGAISQGPAKTIIKNLYECDRGRARIAGVGEVQDVNGNVWVVPGVNHFTSAPISSDLHNECTGYRPNSLSQVNLNKVPVVEVDPDGEIVTGYIFADNYFELYINGVMVGVDSVPFTQFNSSVVKFKVKKPYSIAVKVIDWEENLGLGTESNRGSNYHPGDGGFIASFSDGTITNADWQAQTYYTAPIYDLTCLVEPNSLRYSKTCSTKGVDNGSNAYAIHWKTPSNWQAQSFDSTDWPAATTYTESVIGVDNKKAYMNFREKFAGAGAEFIWSTNVVLDNEVLLRYQVK
ncbi:signal peptide protein [Marinomonas sp. SBI22]|uniref:hypothetical protein n=1 Tax=unclassified Marinomonas TaxID=196814 RepID=UPI0007AF0709|nr:MULTISPECIES: hypothetical protein [unclassified Marinomonas]KZM44867.1 signal peptide protein [Marinomonas sp. SBI22]KZM46566.1 signal peptide protein [Marinomonas sp. SBI8L]